MDGCYLQIQVLQEAIKKKPPLYSNISKESVHICYNEIHLTADVITSTKTLNKMILLVAIFTCRLQPELVPPEFSVYCTS